MSDLERAMVQLEVLPREELVELARLYCRLFAAVDGFWYLAVKELVGEETATACDFWVWDRYTPYELKRLAQHRGIEGKGIHDFATCFSLSPWFSNLTYDLTPEGENRLIFTVRECNTLRSLEREGLGREKTICHQVDLEIFQRFAEHFSPRARVVPLELPPRQSGATICCRWAFIFDE